MQDPIALSLDSAAYPSRLRSLPSPPAVVSVSRPLAPATVVAVVGTRTPHPACAAFARSLATKLSEAGIVVASGGAAGIDTAAHEAALAANGRTWVVAPTGSSRVYPPENRPLFDRVRESDGAIIWPFQPDARPVTFRFWLRNGVMVALADALVVIQAGIPSGTLNAARWARKLGRPVWVVPTPPWMDGCEGSWSLLESGAHALWSVPRFLTTLKANSAPIRSIQTSLDLEGGTQGARPPFTADESTALNAMTFVPRHLDEIAADSGLPISRLATALLTLALENVVVEGPSGFYCRCN